MTFELPLVEERVKPHQVTALHLITALAFTGTGAVLYKLYEPVKEWALALLIAGVALLITVFVRNRWLIRREVNRYFRIGELMILLCISSFMVLKGWTVPAAMFGILSAVVLFALYWERGGGSMLQIRIDTEGIKLPVTSRRRFIEWPDVEQVILRFGILTINCADSRLHQWNVHNTDFDKEVFEAFCQRQVEGARSRRIADW